MKRTLTTLCLLLVACCSLLAQKPITAILTVPGKLKSYYSWRDELEFEKGTSCVLLFVTKPKKLEQGEDAFQAVLVAEGKQFYISLDLLNHYFEPTEITKDQFWNLEQLERIPDYYKEDKYANWRRERLLDADRYISELEKARLFYDDAAIEDYLQCLILEIMPTKNVLNRKISTPIVRLYKSAAPDMMMLGNDIMLVSTGMLTLLDTEDELVALMAREVSHHLMDHALITIKQNVARANRAAFWGAVIDGVVAAAEQTLYERYDYYQPGLLFATNDVIQSLVNQNILNRMGLDYSRDLESKADELALSFMERTARRKDALSSALHKLYDYYRREKDTGLLSKYGAYGTLEERTGKLGKPGPQPTDRDFLKKTRTIISFEAALQDYNKQYENARWLAMKNIKNGLACADDYLMVARSMMKSSNTSESNIECLSYLDKADVVSEVEDVNITKMRILLMLRENMNINAVDMIRKYQKQLDVMFQQPHTEEDAEWITAEHLWAEKLLERIYLN